MNTSSLTRREQVFEYLKTRINQWVDGPELANEVVGGSEGLKRLRELRQELKDQGRYEIEMRGHPDQDRDIYQYRLVERARSVYVEHAPAPPMQVADGSPPERSPQRLNAPDRRGTHLAYDPVADSYIAVYDGPAPDSDGPPPLPIALGQTDMGVPEVEGHKYTSMPKKIELGRSLPCPMCHGIRRALKEKDPVTGKASKHGQVIGYEDWTRNPNKPSETCPRCGGFGLVPA